MLLNLTHAARRPWVRLMQELVNVTSPGMPSASDRELCERTFLRELSALSAMPSIY
jgi:hypothetical protein